MKRNLVLILLLCFSLTLVLGGCGSANKNAEKNPQPAQTDTSWQDIQDKGYFVMGLDDAFPPMGFRDENNEIVGFDIDLAKEAAKRLGVDVKFQTIVWESKVEEINSGNIDVIWNGFSITPEREEQVLFTKPYIKNRQVIVVTANSPIKNKADLEGKKIGIQAGSSAQDAVLADKATYEVIKDNLLEFDDNVMAMRDLKGGGLDAVVVDIIVGKYYVSKHPGEYKFLEEDFGAEDFAVGLRLTDKAFLAEMNKALDAMKADGTASAISDKWFKEDIINK
ncbi:MAG: amino acid ABC transporter substrate-binding protein [Syntrophomonadaceae bacterium]|nr:amino acid ABC transporter substrate-binding protein [Syntrophomonadaceae bacterium]MDD3271230.1 amino acid ABC transporter substrate-binding protein [Syntrophomonadaceae bacterium]MDD4562455.1 amino acid ABC transporter substrate-binding protein [Syntrophomonadaceae bacterium]